MRPAPLPAASATSPRCRGGTRPMSDQSALPAEGSVRPLAAGRGAFRRKNQLGHCAAARSPPPGAVHFRPAAAASGAKERSAWRAAPPGSHVPTGGPAPPGRPRPSRHTLPPCHPGGFPSRAAAQQSPGHGRRPNSPQPPGTHSRCPGCGPARPAPLPLRAEYAATPRPGSRSSSPQRSIPAAAPARGPPQTGETAPGVCRCPQPRQSHRWRGHLPGRGSPALPFPSISAGRSPTD